MSIPMTSDEAMFNRVMAGIERTENALRRMDAEPGGVSTPDRSGVEQAHATYLLVLTQLRVDRPPMSLTPKDPQRMGGQDV